MLVKVWNDNIHPYREMFRNQEIVIEAGSFIEMDEDEALYFEGTFVFPRKNEQGVPDPLFFKKIRREATPPVEVDPLLCHANGQTAKSDAEFKELVGAFKHLLVKDDSAEAERTKALKKENKDLKSRLERLEEHLGLKTEKTSNDKTV